MATHLPRSTERSPEEKVRIPMLDVCSALIPLATLLITGVLTVCGLRFLRD